jgi:predicted extracellular nuclease
VREREQLPGALVQDEVGDGNPATSDGIFVFTGSAPTVAVGNRLRITGTVAEFAPGGAAAT